MCAAGVAGRSRAFDRRQRRMRTAVRWSVLRTLRLRAVLMDEGFFGRREEGQNNFEGVDNEGQELALSEWELDNMIQSSVKDTYETDKKSELVSTVLEDEMCDRDLEPWEMSCIGSDESTVKEDYDTDEDNLDNTEALRDMPGRVAASTAIPSSPSSATTVGTLVRRRPVATSCSSAMSGTLGTRRMVLPMSGSTVAGSASCASASSTASMELRSMWRREEATSASLSWMRRTASSSGDVANAAVPLPVLTASETDLEFKRALEVLDGRGA